MNYEEKYKKALVVVQEILNSKFDALRVKTLRKRFEDVFPELKESEDERIRQSYVLEEQEKQGENVEIKFCRGDKVVSNQDGKVYTVGAEYYITGDNIRLHDTDGNYKWTNRDDLDKNYHLWTSEEPDPCTNCTNDKGYVTCVNGDQRQTSLPKILYSDEVIEWLQKHITEYKSPDKVIFGFIKDFEL